MIGVTTALVLAATQILNGGEIQPDTRFYYAPKYEKYGGIEIDMDGPYVVVIDFGLKIEVCDSQSDFVCAYGPGLPFAVPKNPEDWSENWFYSGSRYRPVELFERSVRGEKIQFVVFEQYAYDGENLSYPRQRYVYSRELGLTAMFKVRVPRQTEFDDPVKSPLIHDFLEPVDEAFGRIYSNDDSKEE